MGRGGGASGRAMAFCPSGLGSNPRGAWGSNLGFFVSDVINLFSLGVRHFSYQLRYINQGDFPLLSYFLSPTMSVHYRFINCNSKCEK